VGSYYYDTEDATTKAFLEDVDKLSQQSITMNVPESCRARRLEN
jgi:uroporphyrin-3 C-methyltransferase